MPTGQTHKRNRQITIEENGNKGIKGLDLLFWEKYMKETLHLTDVRQQAKVKYPMKDTIGQYHYNRVLYHR